jgi:hypothetical protein
MLSLLVYCDPNCICNKCSDQAWTNTSPKASKPTLSEYLFSALKEAPIFQHSVLFIFDPLSRILLDLQLGFDDVLRIRENPTTQSS